MSGISSSALKGANYPENRKKYNGIEFTNELDLNTYDAQLRNLDPQIGRWNQIDPKIENMEAWSPYASNYDNPIRYKDFLGDEPGDPETQNANSSGYDILKMGLEIKAGLKNLLSAVVSDFTSVNGAGPRVVYNVTESINDNGGRTAEITGRVVFDKNSGSRYLNWDVAKGAVNLASLTPAGKVGALNAPMLAAKAGGPTVANEGVKLAEQASYTLTKHGELTNGVYTVSQEAMKKHVFGGVEGKSVFYPTVNANETVLKAAEHADAAGLWNAQGKAKVQVLNTNIGILGNGEPTNFINIYIGR